MADNKEENNKIKPAKVLKKKLLENKDATEKLLWARLVDIIDWVVYALIIGVIVGLVAVAFDRAIEIATATREAHDWLIFLMPVAGILIVAMYRGWGVEKALGTNRVLKSVKGQGDVAVRMAPLIFAAGTLTHLTGGSSGREGAALQIGGSIADFIGRKIKLRHLDKSILVQCGMAAGFSALFGTPLAAAIFAMEIVDNEINYSEMLPCLLSSTVAKVVALALGSEGTKLTVANVPEISGAIAVKVIILGFLVALCSMLFLGIMNLTGKLYEKFFPNQYVRIVAAGLIVLALTLISGTRDYNGAGMPIIKKALTGEAFVLAFLIKIIFTALTLEGGFKGGEIVPTLYIGATFGCVVAPITGLDAGYSAGLGMIAMFCAVTNCPLASVFLAYELFGGQGLLAAALCCAVSYMFSGNYSLYKEQTLLHKKFSFEEAAESARAEEEAEEYKPLIPEE